MVVGGEHGSARSAETVQVPLAEMRRHVAGTAKGLHDGFLLTTKRVAVVLDASPVVGPTRHDGAARRRTIRRARIKSIESQPARRHRIEIWCFEDGVPVITRLAPAHV